MLELIIPESDFYNDAENEFVTLKGAVLQLEHSLVSLSKWESIYHKAFLGKDNKTHKETIDYIKCMTMNRNVDPLIYSLVTNEHIGLVSAYIQNPMTATTFSSLQDKRFSREIITAEIIYYWMITLNIPFECQKWHLNRLLALVKVCNIKNAPKGRPMSKKALNSRNSALNAARRMASGSGG